MGFIIPGKNYYLPSVKFTRSVWTGSDYEVICASFMQNKVNNFSGFQRASSILMILALLWLTISAPFVLESNQRLAAERSQEASSAPATNDATEEDTNPFSNTTEEKAPSSPNTLSEEYLHHHDHSQYHRVSLLDASLYIHGDAGTYLAYHGELLVPPPNPA